MRVLAAVLVVLALAPAATAGVLPEPDPPVRDLIGFKVHYRDLLKKHPELVRVVEVPYRANDGSIRTAYLQLPKWYGPAKHPPLPLVVSPHGRGVPPQVNTRYWGGLAAFGPFAVVSPEGQGRRLTLYSWGWHGQIDDLARMPRILEAALPWFHVDHRRVYAVGSSMGGQETPIHIWWSTRDRIVRNQFMESGRLYRAIERVNSKAPVVQYVGAWAHSAEMRPTTRLPLALVQLKLIALDEPLPRSAKP